MAQATSTVAVLGTGTMGRPMAANMARAGMDVAVWNRTRAAAEPLAEVGARVCDEPGQAVSGADVIVTMLFDADVTAEVMGAALAQAQPGVVWAQCATVGVDGCRRLATLAEESGAVYVDAPVLGTRQPAENAQLVVLASGPEEARPACQPVFDAVGTVRSWLGPAGVGSRLKMVVNSWVLAVNSGTATAMAMARRLDVDPRMFFGSIEGGALDCAYAHIKGDAIGSRSFSPNFTVSGALKDCSLALDAVSGSGPALGELEGIRADLSRAVEGGHGGEDMAAVYLALVDDGNEG